MPITLSSCFFMISSTQVFGNWREPPCTCHLAKKRLEGRHHSLHGTNSHPPSKRWLCGWEDGFSQLVWYKLNIFMEVLEKCNGHHESWVSSGCYWLVLTYDSLTQTSISLYTLTMFDEATKKGSPQNLSELLTPGDDNLARTATVQAQGGRCVGLQVRKERMGIAILTISTWTLSRWLKFPQATKVNPPFWSRDPIQLHLEIWDAVFLKVEGLLVGVFSNLQIKELGTVGMGGFKTKAIEFLICHLIYHW